MIDGKPSRTATIVAAARSLAGAGATRWGRDVDAIAPLLLPPPAARAYRALESLSRRGQVPAALLRWVSAGLIEHAGLRTLAIDAAAGEVIDLGVAQKVVLGAGLDVRAYRLRPLSGMHLFEVDHPSTQAWKRTVAQVLERDGNLTYVPVNFEHELVDERLLASGFDPRRAALWVWEGVTPYLPAVARHATLDALTRISAPGSRLIMSYMTPEVATIPPWLRSTVRAAFAALGEPLLGAVATDDVAAELALRGWSVRSDEGTAGWAQRFAGAHPPAMGFHERVVVADRFEASGNRN